MSEVTQVPALAELLTAPRGERYWLVLEQRRETLERLYTLDTTPDMAWLLDDTRYASARDIGPVAVVTQPGSELWHAFVEGREAALTGIAVSSEAHPDAVLAHLRHRLDARFYGSRQALLRYYDPWVAAHLFADTPSSPWLGPLTALFWYGGTFRQRAQYGPAWYACRQGAGQMPGAGLDTTGPIALTPRQEHDFEEFVAHYPLWQRLVRQALLDEASANHAQCFVAALDEAERLSIPQHHLSDFLALRFEYHQASLPDGLEEQPVEARLAMIQQHLHTREDIGDRA